MYEASTLQRARIRLDALGATRASRAELERRQRRRLGRLLDFVTRQSRFYRRHYADVERPRADFEELPPVTKPTLMANFDDVVTDPAVTRTAVDAFVADRSRIGERFLGRYPVWLTSGTTGEPGVFLQDDVSFTVGDAVGDRWTLRALLDRTAMARLVRGGFRVAEIAVGGGHYAAASGVAMVGREHPFLRDRMRLFSPSRPLSELVERLEAFRPTILVGYATVLTELAREQRAGRLDLRPALVQPSGEPIAPTEKRELRRAFDCVVREIYGSTECYALALECERGTLHANTDWFVIEPVDEDYRPVERGEPSHTVPLTHLAKRIQPLVRYDLGDSVTLFEERCPCGSAFPALQVEGRQGDVLRFQTDDGAVPVFPIPLASVVEAVRGVRRTQILRTGPSALSVRLDLTTDADREAVWTRVERDVNAFLESQGVTDPTVELADEPPRRDPAGGKFRHVLSAVDGD